ncbi:MAG: hypothetical protein R2856_30735 [Caldilineaceae bacterium]
MTQPKRLAHLLFLTLFLLSSWAQPVHAAAPPPSPRQDVAPADADGNIFFTVDYQISADVPDNQNCTADGYKLNIVMEGVGQPNLQGHLEGITIVADVTINLGPGSWWVQQPVGTHVYSSTAQLKSLPTSPTTSMLVPELVNPVPATDSFKGVRECIQSDGTIARNPVDVDPATFINNFNMFVLAAGGLKEVDPGEYLSKFHLYVFNDGPRRIEQRVWWGDRRVPDVAIEPDVEGVFLTDVAADVEVTYGPTWADDVKTNGVVWSKLSTSQWTKRSQAAPQKFIEKIPLEPQPPTTEPLQGWVQLDVNHRRSPSQSKPFTVAPKNRRW